MNLDKARTIAESALIKNGLKDWRFEFDSAKQRFGRCRHSTKHIQLSRRLTELNDESAVREIILHEVGHALAGPWMGHSSVWEDQVRLIGGDPQQFSNNQRGTRELDSPFTATCSSCGTVYGRWRKPPDFKQFCSRHRRPYTQIYWVSTAPSLNGTTPAQIVTKVLAALKMKEAVNG